MIKAGHMKRKKNANFIELIRMTLNWKLSHISLHSKRNKLPRFSMPNCKSAEKDRHLDIDINVIYANLTLF